MTWVKVELDKVAEIILGQSPPGSSYNEIEDGVPFFQGKAEFGELRPTVRKWTTAGTKFAKKDDVLLSVRAPVGPTNLAPCDCAIGRGLAAIRPLGGIESRYLLWAFRATVNDLASRGTGSTFEAVTGAQVRAHVVPVAPLNEQRRIVAAIEEHLSRLDAADGSLAAAERRSELLRGAELEIAFTNGAPRRSIGSIGTLADGPFGSYLKTSHYVAEGPRVVRLQNIGDGVFCDERAHITREHFQTLTKHAVAPGDVVVASLGDEAPRACLIPDWLGDAIVKADCIRLRPNDGVDPGYVMWALNSRPIKTQAALRIKGIGRPRLGLGGIRDLEIPMPRLKEQRRIVAEVEARLSAVDGLRASIERAQRRSKTLRAAVLAKAFRGELVPQDPSDEPAETLLARIRADREVEHAHSGLAESAAHRST